MVLPFIMIGGKLNYNEKLVLYGMIRYPLLNDRELTDKLKLKMTTVTAIKNRLKRNNFYSTIRVPVLQYFGTELFTAIRVSVSPLVTEQEFIVKMKDFSENIPEFFYAGVESGNGFGLGFSRNYTDLITTMEQMSFTIRKQELVENLEPPIHSYAIFPLKNSIILNFFDFSQVLSREFGISFGDEPDDIYPSLPKPKKDHLTNIEKRVLYGLVNYPNLPDSKISEKIGVTRQVISKLKKQFEDDGLIKTIKIPNFKQLGYEILVLAHNHHNPLTPISKRKKGIKMVMSELPNIFVISGNLESFVISIVKDFQEFQELKSKTLALYKQENYLIEEPDIQLYSIRNLNIIINHKYGPIVKKIFELEDID